MYLLGTTFWKNVRMNGTWSLSLSCLESNKEIFSIRLEAVNALPFLPVFVYKTKSCFFKMVDEHHTNSNNTYRKGNNKFPNQTPPNVTPCHHLMNSILDASAESSTYLEGWVRWSPRQVHKRMVRGIKETCGPPPFFTPETNFMEDYFSIDGGGGWGVRGWFRDDSSTLHLSCTLFLLWLYQLHLISSGITPQRLGTPEIEPDRHNINIFRRC